MNQTLICPKCLGTNTIPGESENCDYLWCNDCVDFTADISYIGDLE